MLHREAVMWKRLTHPNIVPFKGVTLDPLRIVSVWMPGGDRPVTDTQLRFETHALHCGNSYVCRVCSNTSRLLNVRLLS